MEERQRSCWLRRAGLIVVVASLGFAGGLVPLPVHAQKELKASELAKAKRLCAKGKAGACTAVGEHHLTKFGSDSGSAAVRFLSKGCDAGDANGCKKLTGAFYNGRPIQIIRKNLKRAGLWGLKGCKLEEWVSCGLAVKVRDALGQAERDSLVKTLLTSCEGNTMEACVLAAQAGVEPKTATLESMFEVALSVESTLRSSELRQRCSDWGGEMEKGRSHDIVNGKRIANGRWERCTVNRYLGNQRAARVAVTLSSNSKGPHEVKVYLKPGSVGTLGFNWSYGGYGKTEAFQAQVKNGLIAEWMERYELPEGEDAKYNGWKYRNDPPSGAEITRWNWGDVMLTLSPKQLAKSRSLAKASGIER